MAESKTNFALLLKLLGIRSRDLCDAVGVHKTLVSRWCNGRQKMISGNRYVQGIADYLLAFDARLKEPVLPEILAAYYPDEILKDPELYKPMLLKWLENVGWREAVLQTEERGLAENVLGRITNIRNTDSPYPNTKDIDPPFKNTIAYDVTGVQGSALHFIDIAMEQSQPCHLLFVCPEGLEMYTRDERFSVLLMDRLMIMFEAGHTLDVVLRTDYRMTDVSLFSGRWLVAHLLGYIKSYYFDDFLKSYENKMLVVIKNRVAMKVTDLADETERRVYTAIYYDDTSIEQIWQECESFRRQAKQRFLYNLFENPQGFLANTHPKPDKSQYQFARLPHFCIVKEKRFQEDFALTEKEMSKLYHDFSPFLSYPEFFNESTPIRHVFCENDIEEVLLKNRHGCQPLTTILDRRVFMQTQVLVDRLTLIKNLLEKNLNYEVCFLRDEHFNMLTMQIATWSDTAAIGWIPAGKSAACKDYTNVNALSGFCAGIWDKIPTPLKMRRTSVRKINTWLKMAKKYGYNL